MKRDGYIFIASEKICATIKLLQKQSVFIPEDLAKQFHESLMELNEVRVEQFMARNGRPMGAPPIKPATALGRVKVRPFGCFATLTRPATRCRYEIIGGEGHHFNPRLRRGSNKGHAVVPMRIHHTIRAQAL
jgi:hypothetical protein